MAKKLKRRRYRVQFASLIGDVATVSNERPPRARLNMVQTAGRITACATMRTTRKIGNRIGGSYQCQFVMLQFLVEFAA
jgi:hypothetical protein